MQCSQRVKNPFLQPLFWAASDICDNTFRQWQSPRSLNPGRTTELATTPATLCGR